MKLTESELKQIIQEEINEIFGFGKKRKPTKEYPASELATLVRGIDKASRMAGAQLTSGQREAIVDELTSVLQTQGFVVKENERLMTGEEDVVVTHENAPKLKVFLDTVAQKNPKVFKQLLGLFNRSALDISAAVKDIIPSITTVADPEPDEDHDDEDQKATTKTKPVATPDSKATRKAPEMSRRERRRLEKLRDGPGAFEPDPWVTGGRGDVPVKKIMDLDLEDKDEKAIAKLLRDAGYKLTEAEIKKLKVLSGVK